jgi:XapX domain-containing protein
VTALLVSLLVGLGIGIFLKILGLPVPVPHSFGGIMGLIGMFAGAELVVLICDRLGV